MGTSEVLNRAADLIEQGGWYSMANGGSGVCTGNAIYAVSDRDMSIWGPAQRALADYLGGVGRVALYVIWEWNDATERTATEVIEVLRACAVIEAAKENADARESVTA